MTIENKDEGVHRSWTRISKSLPAICDPFYWTQVSHDKLLVRQYYMMREGHQSLHNMIYGDHGLPNKY